MSKFYTYDAWVRDFQPMANSIRNNGDLQYETYGDELEYVRQQDIKHVWTEVDGDNGTYIVAGYSRVNRIQYFITNKPWIDEWTEVPTWVYRDCDCRTEENDWEPNPECSECEEGLIDIPMDTVVDLKSIYGEEAPIVG